MNEKNIDQNQKPRTSKLASASIVLLAIPFLLVVLLLILWAILENLEFPNWLNGEAHKGRDGIKGCYVAFADGSARFVKKENLGTLRWEP